MSLSMNFSESDSTVELYDKLPSDLTNIVDAYWDQMILKEKMKTTMKELTDTYENTASPNCYGKYEIKYGYNRIVHRMRLCLTCNGEILVRRRKGRWPVYQCRFCNNWTRFSSGHGGVRMDSNVCML